MRAVPLLLVVASLRVVKWQVHNSTTTTTLKTLLFLAHSTLNAFKWKRFTVSATQSKNAKKEHESTEGDGE